MKKLNITFCIYIDIRQREKVEEVYDLDESRVVIRVRLQICLKDIRGIIRLNEIIVWSGLGIMMGRGGDPRVVGYGTRIGRDNSQE